MFDVNTELLGVIGYPLGHSLSPLLHNHAIKELGLNMVYLGFAIKPELLKEGVQGFRALNIKGINVTIPYKEKVIPFLDEVDSLASKVGAVNTIVNKQGDLKGYNTDVIGVQRLIEDDGNFKIKGKKALVLGAGGASRAVGISLCQNGIKEIYVLNRTETKAEKLLNNWQRLYPEIKMESGVLSLYPSILAKVDIVIDTTPIGMAPDIEAEPIIDAKSFHSNLLVVDLVYNPTETTILKAARQAGAQVLNGMGMLLYQGIEAFRLWTGIEPEVQSWRDLVENFI